MTEQREWNPIATAPKNSYGEAAGPRILVLSVTEGPHVARFIPGLGQGGRGGFYTRGFYQIQDVTYWAEIPKIWDDDPSDGKFRPIAINNVDTTKRNES